MMQHVAIREIFGDEFVYNNQNGNLAIRQIVLGKFRKLTKGKADWSRSGTIGISNKLMTIRIPLCDQSGDDKAEKKINIELREHESTLRHYRICSYNRSLDRSSCNRNTSVAHFGLAALIVRPAQIYAPASVRKFKMTNPVREAPACKH